MLYLDLIANAEDIPNVCNTIMTDLTDMQQAAGPVFELQKGSI